MIIGIFILIIGLFFLLENLGLIAASFWNILWPLILITVGISLILKRKRYYWRDCKDKNCKDCGGWNNFGDKMKDFGDKMQEKFHK